MPSWARPGSTGGLTFDGGTLSVRHDFHTFRAVTITAAGGTIEAFATPATFAGVISGPGALTKTGNSELVLTGPGNSYAGGTFINAGSVRVATDSLLGAPSGVTINSGTLIVGGGFTSARPITLDIGGGRLDTYGGIATFTGQISGIGGLIKGSSANTIVLTSTNDYGGGTWIDNGTLKIGDGGTTGSILGDVLNEGVLTFDRSNSYQVANTIRGIGDVRVIGGGVATLTGLNSYTGETRIEGVAATGQGSTLVANFLENLGSASGAIVLSGNSALVSGSSYELARLVTLLDTTQTFDASDAATVTTISGRVVGAGALRKAGLGTLVLTNVTNSLWRWNARRCRHAERRRGRPARRFGGWADVQRRYARPGRSLRFRTNRHAQCRRGDDPDGRRRQCHPRAGRSRVPAR